MVRTFSFDDSEFYHVYNRGVDKRTIFLSHRDYSRFLLALEVFNNSDSSPNFRRLLDAVRGPTSNKVRGSLVDIAAFCLMPNHFHLLVRQRGQHGVTQFMRKLGTGYTMYFNKKNERSGVLFQGRFKAVHVKSDPQLEHLARYIHLNPLDLLESRWKDRGVKNWIRAASFLEQYPWSSYSHFLGLKSLENILDTGLVRKYFDGGKSHAQFVRQWAVRDRGLIDDLVLD